MFNMDYYERKVIPGYENYEIDTNGNVWSFYSNVWTKRKLDKHRQGYLRVELCSNGKCRKFLVHRLVMLAFNGESDLTVNHINGIKDDNRLENLEYCTQSENSKHAFKIGLKVAMKGEINPMCKLTDEDVKEIKRELLNYKLGMYKVLSERYGVTKENIGMIRRNKTWKHIKI